MQIVCPAENRTGRKFDLQTAFMVFRVCGIWRGAGEKRRDHRKTGRHQSAACSVVLYWRKRKTGRAESVIMASSALLFCLGIFAVRTESAERSGASGKVGQTDCGSDRNSLQNGRTAGGGAPDPAGLPDFGNGEIGVRGEPDGWRTSGFVGEESASGRFFFSGAGRKDHFSGGRAAAPEGETKSRTI